jgi:hypothetical protein
MCGYIKWKLPDATDHAATDASAVGSTFQIDFDYRWIPYRYLRQYCITIGYVSTFVSALCVLRRLSYFLGPELSSCSLGQRILVIWGDIMVKTR